MRIPFARPLAGALAAAALGACSGDGSSFADGQGNVAVISASDPARDTASGSSGGQQALAEGSTAQSPFASFDFAGGTRYPERATLSLQPAWYRPGASTAYVAVKLDHATPNTVIARIHTVNGSARAGADYRSTTATVIFRPGDPLKRTLSVPILSSVAGARFYVKLSEAVHGAKQGTDWAPVTADAGQTPTPAATWGFRAARTFRPIGALQWQMTRDTMRWSDEGHDGAWSTKLPNGRAQPGNGETGIYLDGYLYPWVEPPLRYTDEGLVMHTQKLWSWISWNGQGYGYGAVALSGHNTRPLQIGYGQYEWVAKMPNRWGSWPALWLIATSGWPPEIDVYEGFGFDSYWNFDRDISATIHGGRDAVRYFTRGEWIQARETYDLSGFAQGFHRYAVDIGPYFITWFVDGQETYQSVNPFRGFRWYPIMDVAVKTTGPYADGSGDMIVKSFRVYAN